MLNHWFLLIYTITKQSVYKLHKAINTVENTPVDNIDSKQTYCYKRIYKIQHSMVYKTKTPIFLTLKNKPVYTCIYNYKHIKTRIHYPASVYL